MQHISCRAYSTGYPSYDSQSIGVVVLVVDTAWNLPSELTTILRPGYNPAYGRMQRSWR